MSYVYLGRPTIPLGIGRGGWMLCLDPWRSNQQIVWHWHEQVQLSPEEEK
jgi:hypothetical protein